MELHSLEDYIEQYRSQGAPEDQQMLIALMRDAQQLDGGALRQETIDRIASELSIRREHEGPLRAARDRLPEALRSWPGHPLGRQNVRRGRRGADPPACRRVMRRFTSCAFPSGGV